MMLTRKQRELLQILSSREAAGLGCPSFDEMKDALGLKSKSGVQRLVVGLEERGFIRRMPHRARAIEVIRGTSEIEDRELLRRRLADAEALLRHIWLTSPETIALARHRMDAEAAVRAARGGQA